MSRFFRLPIWRLLCGLLFASPSAWAADVKEITVTVPTSFPPYYQLDAKNRPVGFAIDVMDAIAKRAGYTIRYETNESWPDVVRALREGDAFLIPNLGITAERARFADFTPPVETFPVSIFVRKGTNIILGSDQLRGKKVAVVAYNVGVALLAGRQDLTTVVYDDVQGAMFDLLAGGVDALVYPEPVAWHLARLAGVHDRLKVVGTPMAEIKRAIAVRKGLPDLHRRLSIAVSQFVNTPQYQAIYVKWFGPPQALLSDDRTVQLLALEGVALAVFVGLALYLWWLNRQLKAARRAAEGAAETKTRVLAAAGHDIRQPAQALHLYLSTLQTHDLPPESRTVVDDMATSVGKLSGLLDHMVMIAKLDADMVEPRREHVTVSDVLAICAREASATAAGEGTRFHYVPCTVTVSTDPALLRSMVQGLLSNALKFARGGKVVLGCRRRGDHVVVQVLDNGRGIPSDRMDDIFNEFVQLGQVPRERDRNREQGLGIGLTIVKRLAQLLGHRVQVVSRRERGSVFSIEVPVANQNESGA